MATQQTFYPHVYTMCLSQLHNNIMSKGNFNIIIILYRKDSKTVVSRVVNRVVGCSRWGNYRGSLFNYILIL